MTSAAPLISLSGVALPRRVGSVPTVVDWSLYPDERWAIVGPTASGKSLLAQAIAGTGPLYGEGVVHHFLQAEDRTSDGAPIIRPAADPARVRAHVAYVTFEGRPQGEALFHQARWHAQPDATSPTVEDYLAAAQLGRRHPYEVASSPPAQDKAALRAHREGVIADLELASLLPRRLHHLSDGEWHRVKIGRVLLRRPRFLVLDDPFTGLDKGFRAQFRRLLSEFVEGEMYVILVVSDPADLPETITHVLALPIAGQAVMGPRAQVLPARDRMRPQPQPGCHPVRVVPACKGAGVEMPAVVEMRAVNVTHNGVAVLRDIDWTVRQGEKWALIGPNGAGKTTLLSLILGDHPQAYANHIVLFGQRRGSGESIWEIKRRIGWVAPELHRYMPPHVTALDLVCSGFLDTLGLSRRCTAEQRTKGLQWMAHFGLGERAAHPFRTLSKGEQRLTLIARALVKSPELLILDEPCQGLDAANLARVLQALTEMTARPTVDPSVGVPTMIYVTHKPQEFPGNLTHVLELARGRVVQQAPLASPQAL